MASPEGLFAIGASLCFISILGKSSTKFYRAVQAGKAFNSGEAILGQYYKGGFAPTMTRREAGLILGVRETAEADKIMVAHRKLMFLNHPDNGGSTHIATKINEAKEMLMVGSDGKK